MNETMKIIFGFLFEGIETMGSVMKPLASNPFFTDLIGKVAGVPVLGVAVGTIMTLVVQSSSATIAVLQNFASQPAAALHLVTKEVIRCGRIVEGMLSKANELADKNESYLIREIVSDGEAVQSLIRLLQ